MPVPDFGFLDSVWKPLHGPVHSSPLAVCDYRTVKDEDLVPTDIIFPDYLGETYNFFPSAEHRWYYIDGQQADEAWMIKCFDSATTVNPEVAQCMFSALDQWGPCDLELTSAPSRSPCVISIYQAWNDPWRSQASTRERGGQNLCLLHVATSKTFENALQCVPASLKLQFRPILVVQEDDVSVVSLYYGTPHATLSPSTSFKRKHQ